MAEQGQNSDDGGNGGNFNWTFGNGPITIRAQGRIPSELAAVGQHIPQAVLQRLSSLPGQEGVRPPLPMPQQHPHTHSHSHSAPPSSDAHVVDMGATPLDSAPGAPGPAEPGTAEESQEGRALAMLLPWLARSGVFFLLLFFKLGYQHRIGLMVLVGLFATFWHGNSQLSKVIGNRDRESRVKNVLKITWIVAFLTGNAALIYYIFNEDHLYRSLYFTVPEVDLSDVWTMLWVLIINDFILKYATVVLKSLITLVPTSVLPAKRRSKWYVIVEHVSQMYRQLITITPWLAYLGAWSVLACIYALFKGFQVFGKVRELWKAFKAFTAEVPYGVVASQEDMKRSGEVCAICHDDYCEPIMLSCKHVFCEECVSTWFDRDRTCPMCRAKIIADTTYRDGSTPYYVQWH